jgi:hypothetical protein
MSVHLSLLKGGNMLHPLHPKRLIWLIIAIACAAMAVHLAVGLAADLHNEAYLIDDRISEGEKGWDLEIYDGRYIAFVFAFPDRLVRNYGEKVEGVPKGWKYERKIDVLTYCSIQEAVDVFLDVANENNPKFKIVDGQNSPSNHRHFGIEVWDPGSGLLVVEIDFIGNRADVQIHNGYQTTGRTEAFLSALKATIRNRKIIKG